MGRARGVARTMSIKNLPAATRPREKLLALGPQALADAELLACCCARVCRARACSNSRDARARRIARAGRACCVPMPTRWRASRGSGRPSAPSWARCSRSRGARCREQLADVPVFDNPHGGQAVRRAAARRARPRGVRGAVSRQPAPAAEARGDVSRHAHPHQRVSARGGAPRARAQQRGGHLCAQPSVGRGRAVARRRVPDAIAEVGAATGRRARARPPGGRARRRWCRSPSGACCERRPAAPKALAPPGGTARSAKGVQ